MKILIVGGGGREHALVWKLAQEEGVEKIYCAPGNGGIGRLAECVSIKAGDINGLADFAERHSIDLTIAGTEVPLVKGIADIFGKRGLKIFGPEKEAARLEGSKVFAKDIMRRYGIPTADAGIFGDFEKASSYIKGMENMPVVVKADGLAAGKGVIVAETKEEALAAAESMMKKMVFGEAGKRIIVEECLTGQEVSVLAFTDGKNILPLLPSQDHKRIYENDKGPNTGGMGAYSPVPFVSEGDMSVIKKDILEAVVQAMEKEGCPYRGVLYAGLMITEEGPKVLEFNVRFGDPETQAILPLLDSDMIGIMMSPSISGCVISWKPLFGVCVVVASGGYPAAYKTGIPVTGLDRIKDAIVFHAGTKYSDNTFFTSGGRVLGVTGIGTDLEKAAENAYSAVSEIRFNGMYYRKDIARKAVNINETCS